MVTTIGTPLAKGRMPGAHYDVAIFHLAMGVAMTNDQGHGR